MSDDIVSRLRAADEWMRVGLEGVAFHDDAPFDAADEIERLRAELAAERETNATNQAAIERFRQHESELREALNPLADAKPLRRDLDVYVVAGRDVRYARMTLDAALKGDGDE